MFVLEFTDCTPLGEQRLSNDLLWNSTIIQKNGGID